MPGIDAPAGGHPAPYGRACVNCARAKCRCIYRIADASCERCHRLKKHCEPSVTVRKRNGRRQTGSRTAQLEEKLEDLVSLLRNQSTAGKPPAAGQAVSIAMHESSRLDQWASTPAPSHTETAPTGSSDDRSDSNPAGGASTGGPQTPAAIFGAAFSPGLFNHQTTVPVPISSMIQSPWMPTIPREAEERLTLFRDRYLRCFPCIYIPPDMTSEQLREEKPFTWYTIMMMSCQTSSLQYGMGSVWQRVISQKIVIEHEKNIDLLQGMVIFLAWSQYHKKDRPYLSIFTQLALSQVYDLSLNKVAGESPAFSCFKPSAFNQYFGHRERTMEDRRTVLACFYITSQIAFTLKKMEGLRWTAHMNDCLNFLNEHPEWPGDQVLAAQVRVHLVVDQLSSDGTVLPPYYQLAALSSPIDAAKNQLPPGLENNEIIRIQLLYSELAILENSLGRTPYNPKKPDLRRYEILSRTADIVKRWFDIFFVLSKADYTALSFALWCQLAHCVMSLYKLSVLDESAWDRAALRRDIDVIEVCDRIIRDMDAAGAYRRQSRPEPTTTTPSQLSPDTDMFTACAKMIIAMRNGWASELGVPQIDPNGPAPNGPPYDNGFVDNITTGPMAVPTSFLDDTWLTDIFNISWE